MTFIVADRVRDTSTTAGTGNFAVSGTAPIAYRTFSAVCTTNDTLPVFIQHQTLDEWEVGIYTYSAANELTRTLILSSSNSGSVVTFSAGTKDVVLGIPARNAYAREVLKADRIYYVRTDGNDTNTGLVDSSGGAFLTIQKALDVVYQTLDLQSFVVTIQLGDGTYAAGATISGNYVGSKGSTGLQVLIAGNAGTPANVVIGAPIICYSGARLAIAYCKIASSSDGLVSSDSGSFISFFDMDFGACTGAHIVAIDGGHVSCAGNYTISGNAVDHIFTDEGVFSCGASTITLTGTPAFSSVFAAAYDNGIIDINGATYSGSATGPRFLVQSGGIIDPHNTSLTYLPGSIAGSTAAGTYDTFSDLTSIPSRTMTGASGTMTTLDSALVVNASGTFTLTLVDPTTSPGHWLYIKTIAPFAVSSASSNVVPLGSATAGTAILHARVGQWATLQSNGTNWVILATDTDELLLTDKGTVGTGTVTFDVSAASKQKLTVSGSLTIAFSNWAASGTYDQIELQLVNGGSNVTWPTVSWMKGDGTSSTTFSSMGVTLSGAGTNWVIVWTTDGGTTLYGIAT